MNSCTKFVTGVMMRKVKINPSFKIRINFYVTYFISTPDLDCERIIHLLQSTDLILYC